MSDAWPSWYRKRTPGGIRTVPAPRPGAKEAFHRAAHAWAMGLQPVEFVTWVCRDRGIVPALGDLRAWRRLALLAGVNPLDEDDRRRVLDLLARKGDPFAGLTEEK